MPLVFSTMDQLSLVRAPALEGVQWHRFKLCQELLAQFEAVDGDGGVDGRAGMDVGKGGVYDSPMAQDYYDAGAGCTGSTGESPG